MRHQNFAVDKFRLNNSQSSKSENLELFLFDSEILIEKSKKKLETKIHLPNWKFQCVKHLQSDYG